MRRLLTLAVLASLSYAQTYNGGTIRAGTWGVVPLGTVISNVVATPGTVGTETITWNTTTPSTSQVIYPNDDNNGLSASLKDTTLVTSHSVSLSVHPGTAQYYYVASTNSYGSSTSRAGSYAANNTFTPTSVNISGAVDFRFSVFGPQYVYRGSDLYAKYDSTMLSGATQNLYFDPPPSGLPAGVTVHWMCATNNDLTNESADSWWDGSIPYSYGGSDDLPSTGALRIRTSGSTPLGVHSIVLSATVGSVVRTTTFSFTVLAPPSITYTSPVTVPSIPSQALWLSLMTGVGSTFCDPSQTLSFGYEPQIWYYDGGRSFFQLADYTADAKTWEPCALNIVGQYRDAVIADSGGMTGWRVFPHGLAMNYWRTGDTVSKTAVTDLSTGSAYAYSLWNNGGVGTDLLRETAFMIDTWTLAEQLGSAHDPRLDRGIDYALGQLNMTVDSDGTLFHQPYMVGLIMEALIQYYTLYPDPRIPPTIKRALDYEWTWYNSSVGIMAYNTLDVPPSLLSALNMLITPAYAWYWALSGDTTYLTKGDTMFVASLGQDFSYQGKTYNQNARWSFDYVNWRTLGTPAQSVVLNVLTPPTLSVLALTSTAPGTIMVSGGNTVSVKLWLNRLVGMVTVVSLSDSGSRLTFPATVTVPVGQLSVAFNVTAIDGVVATDTLTATLGATSAHVDVRIKPSAWGTVDIAAIYGLYFPMHSGATGNGVLYLSGPAPAGGMTVTLTSSDPSAFAIPATLYFAPGVSQLDLVYTVGTVTVPTSVTVTATLGQTLSQIGSVIP